MICSSRSLLYCSSNLLNFSSELDFSKEREFRGDLGLEQTDFQVHAFLLYVVGCLIVVEVVLRVVNDAESKRSKMINE